MLYDTTIYIIYIIFDTIDIISIYTINYHKIDTSKLDVTPIWKFIGLEDGRIVNWDDKYYAIGVRRDTTTNGQGRMEFSEFEP